MSLILKQESEGSISTPASGKGVLYINTSGELAVKKTDGTSGQTAYAAVANSVSVSNVAGIGNVALLNLTGSSSNVLYGNGVFAPAAGGGSYGNSNVATFLSSFGSNTITTSGYISSTGNVNGGNMNAGNMFVDGTAYLGAVGNVVITGGSAGYVLTTNGSGTLSWSAGSGGSYGNSNVATFLSSFGSNTITTSGVISSTGNVNGGNINAGNMFVDGIAYLGAVGNITITGGSAGQVLRTNGSGALSWVNQSGGGGGSPGGSDTQIQFNDAGSFGGAAAFTYDNANNMMTVTTATIGNIYYEDNILAPIPTYVETEYGNTIVHTPLSVSAPIEVLSSDTSDTVLFTLSGAQLAGGQSGGTNNVGTIYTGSTNYSVIFNLFGVYQTSAQTALANIRVNDVVTAIGTNGYFTGSYSFTVTDVTLLPPTPGNVNSTFCQITGILIGFPGASNFNANILQIYRPYSESSIAGGITAGFLNVDEVVAEEVVVNTNLVAVQSTLGQVNYNGDPQSSTFWSSPTQLNIDTRGTDYFSYSDSGTGGSITQMNFTMWLPTTNTGYKEWTVQIAFQNSFTFNFGSTGTIFVYAQDGAFVYSNPITYKWQNNTPPTSISAGQTIVFKFMQSFVSTSPDRLCVSYQIYG